jgi:deoxyribonuclease V
MLGSTMAQPMIHVARPHQWDITVQEAREIQRELAGLVSLTPPPELQAIGIVAGIDNGYVKQETGWVAYAAAVVFAFPALELVVTAIGEAPVTFPYVPGFLTFREGPAILAALAGLTTKPDVLLFDGQGYAHPRRIGLATHMGVVLDHPTIGCAKTRLVGKFDDPPDEPGAISPLIDRGEVVGAAVRTKPGHEPLFVSPGHKVDVDLAVRITLACCREGEFLPVPTRAAHDAVTNYTAPLRRRR